MRGELTLREKEFDTEKHQIVGHDYILLTQMLRGKNLKPKEDNIL
jgi:hypothetical protein